MKAICTICALALASSLLVVGADDKKKEADKKDVGTVIGIDLGTTYSWWVFDCTVNLLHRWVSFSGTSFFLPTWLSIAGHINSKLVEGLFFSKNGTEEAICLSMVASNLLKLVLQVHL